MSDIGSMITLITSADIRYVGRLSYIDTEKNTVGLADVQMRGTEDRPAKSVVPPSDRVFELVVFNGQDIKELQVVEQAPPPQQAVVPPPPPPQMQQQQPFGGPHHHGGFHQQMPPPPQMQQQQPARGSHHNQQGGLNGPPQTYGGPSSFGGRGGPGGYHNSRDPWDMPAPRPGAPAPQHMPQQQQQQYSARAPQQQQQQQQPLPQGPSSSRGFYDRASMSEGFQRPQQQQQPQQQQGAGGMRGSHHNAPGGLNSAMPTQYGPGGPSAAGGSRFEHTGTDMRPNQDPRARDEFKNEFDFERSRQEFEKAREQRRAEKAQQAATAATTGGGAKYNKTSSFFDTISCDTTERIARRAQQQPHQQQQQQQHHQQHQQQGNFRRPNFRIEREQQQRTDEATFGHDMVAQNRQHAATYRPRGPPRSQQQGGGQQRL